MTADYFACGVVGQAALYGDIQENHVRPVIWQAYMDGSGPEWAIQVDFATHGDFEETWNVNVLCLKRGTHLETERPLFRAETLYLESSVAHHYATAYRPAEYQCGVVGVSAERGDIQEFDKQAVVLEARMVPVGDTWQVQAEFATHGKDEDWRVDLLCVNADYVKPWPPPP